MTEEQLTTATVGELVTEDFRRAAVFEQFDIDFCCNGGRSLADACRAAHADISDVVHALDALPAAFTTDEKRNGDSIPAMIDHIVTTHHAYVRAAMPMIARQLSKVATAHGWRDPELMQVVEQFDQLRGDLEQHMAKEEQVLFPYLLELEDNAGSCGRGRSPFGTVENPIRMMEREHAAAGDDMQRIRQLTHGYAVPADGCTTYRIAMEELKAFERDLHRHVHLENNVLFPAAVRLERRVLGGVPD